MTIKDISEKTGLSLGTISNFLNGKNVREKNKYLIETAIEELGYNVNMSARSLKTKQSKLIGLVIPSTGLTFSAKLVSVVEEILSKKGFMVMITVIGHSPFLDYQKLINLQSRNADAMIIIPSTNNEALENWLKSLRSSIPIIILDRIIEDYNKAKYVLVNNESASKMAVDYLNHKNHKLISIIGGDMDGYTTIERMKGYKKSLEENHIEMNPEYIVYSDFTKRGGYLACEKLFQLKNLPSAIFVTNYDMTLGVIEYLNEHNIQIGKDISLIGFDLDELTKIVNPTITMIIQPIREMAEYTAYRLLDFLKRESYERTPMIFTCILKEGGSVAELE
ncbi:LacI family DNA-binding transcriptional regulator [Neobacillus sp. YIM B06451]|uniref:LacI family DNA-binding transcriptional regulator n=1 Tax=Neobacillus sp. YIM B06451 TaxID=3070994 RepID=UPI00292F27A3|nr:LacI family DNA-binding transcriptional regulator [Neobacillus sp. YIM B06451]